MMKVCHTAQDSRAELSVMKTGKTSLINCHSAPAAVMKPTQLHISIPHCPSQPAPQETVERHLVGGRHGSEGGEVGRELGQRRSRRSRDSGNAGGEGAGAPGNLSAAAEYIL